MRIHPAQSQPKRVLQALIVKHHEVDELRDPGFTRSWPVVARNDHLRKPHHHRIFICKEKLRRIRRALDLLDALRRRMHRFTSKRPLVESRKSCRHRSRRQNPQQFPPLNPLPRHNPSPVCCNQSVTAFMCGRCIAAPHVRTISRTYRPEPSGERRTISISARHKTTYATLTPDTSHSPQATSSSAHADPRSRYIQSSSTPDTGLPSKSQTSSPNRSDSPSRSARNPHPSNDKFHTHAETSP